MTAALRSAFSSRPGTDALAELAATTASGKTPPAGPSWKRGALPPLGHDRDFARHLSVGRAGFTLHAATRAGAIDERGRETLLKYVLRPPIAQERLTQGPEGLVRIGLKKRFSDGTFAVDLDPRSLLTRLCAAVPPPRFHTVGTSACLRRRVSSVRHPARASRRAVRCRRGPAVTDEARGARGQARSKTSTSPPLVPSIVTLPSSENDAASPASRSRPLTRAPPRAT